MASPTRTACVIVGATPDQVGAVGLHERIALRTNRLGTLVTGRPGELVIDFASEFAGPVHCKAPAPGVCTAPHPVHHP